MSIVTCSGNTLFSLDKLVYNHLFIIQGHIPYQNTLDRVLLYLDFFATSFKEAILSLSFWLQQKKYKLMILSNTLLDHLQLWLKAIVYLQGLKYPLIIRKISIRSSITLGSDTRSYVNALHYTIEKSVKIVVQKLQQPLQLALGLLALFLRSL